MESTKNSSVFQHIRQAVSKIPEGKVSTYGAIAHLVGIRDARQVGWAIYGNQDPQVPCHRVVNKQGFLAKDFSLGGWEEQRRRLLPERITFLQPHQVDLSQHLWTGV